MKEDWDLNCAAIVDSIKLTHTHTHTHSHTQRETHTHEHRLFSLWYRLISIGQSQLAAECTRGLHFLLASAYPFFFTPFFSSVIFCYDSLIRLVLSIRKAQTNALRARLLFSLATFLGYRIQYHFFFFFNVIILELNGIIFYEILFDYFK